LKRSLALVAAAVIAVAGIASAYPIAKERELGERFSLEASGMLPLLREPEVLVFLDRMGQRIVSQLDAPQPFEYAFRVVRDPTLNAFAVPGGFVFVHSGLLLRASNDSELASVLGHEIAHSHAHHIVRQQEKSQLASYAALAGMLLSAIQPALGAAAVGASATVQLKYQREFEQEADYLGVRFIRKAGYDPRAAVSFLKRILDEQRLHPLDVPPYLLSHPLTDERITNLEAATRGDPPPSGVEPTFAFERVQAIVGTLTGDRAWVSRAAEARGSEPREIALRGIVRLHLGDFEGALRDLREARSRGQKGLDGDIGLALLRSGKLGEAIAVLRGAAEADPGDPVVQTWLGVVRFESGDFAGAQQELQAAVAATPVLDEAAMYLGQAYGRAGDPARGLYWLARAYELRGDLERAYSHYGRALQQLPEGSPEAEAARRRAALLAQVLTERMLQRRSSQ
jgi:predicted Zn-dependent protease